MDQQPLPQSNPPPPAQPVPPPPKNNSGLFIGILVFILGIATGLMIDKTTILSNIRIPYLSATPTPTPLVTPTPTPDPTANWKTYTNNNLDFSFKYPVDYFKFQEESSTGVYLAPSKGQGGNGPKFLEKTDLWLDVSDETPVDLSPETPKNPVIIGGLSGYKIESDFAAVAGNVRIYDYLAWVSKDNKLYTISLSSWDPNTLKNSEKLFDQILSTFKFVGQNDRVNYPATRPQVCSMLCVQPPPYLCGSDGKSYCSDCQACSNPRVSWYVMQDTPCAIQIQ